jgi:hypothetical protein
MANGNMIPSTFRDWLTPTFGLMGGETCFARPFCADLIWNLKSRRRSQYLHWAIDMFPCRNCQRRYRETRRHAPSDAQGDFLEGNYPAGDRRSQRIVEELQRPADA